MKYMLLFIADEGAWSALSSEEIQEAIGRIGSWYGENAQAGRIREGHRLQSARASTTVVLGPAGNSQKPKVVDGPFLESKEVIGSYAIAEVAGRDEAIAMASTWPGGGAVEIRPVMD